LPGADEGLCNQVKVTEGKGMNFRDANVESVDGKYLSKKVMVNGQFVTLYSANGQTWVSSPEDLPALMDRLENARISLTPGEKVAEGEPAAAPAKPEPAEEEKPAAPKVLQTKYRMKGPKPRPILRQGGVVIMGTPIEPISASNAALSFSSDVDYEEESDSKSRSSKAAAKARPGKAGGQPASNPKAAKGKQVDSHKKMIAPVLRKPVVTKPESAKSKAAAKAGKIAPVKAAVSQASKSAPKSTAKAGVAPKASVPKKVETKKVEVKKATSQAKKTASDPKKSTARPAKVSAVNKPVNKHAKKPAKKGKASKR